MPKFSAYDFFYLKTNIVNISRMFCGLFASPEYTHFLVFGGTSCDLLLLSWWFLYCALCSLGSEFLGLVFLLQSHVEIIFRLSSLRNNKMKKRKKEENTLE